MPTRLEALRDLTTIDAQVTAVIKAYRSQGRLIRVDEQVVDALTKIQSWFGRPLAYLSEPEPTPEAKPAVPPARRERRESIYLRRK
jgi:hypothetical protein